MSSEDQKPSDAHQNFKLYHPETWIISEQNEHVIKVIDIETIEKKKKLKLKTMESWNMVVIHKVI